MKHCEDILHKADDILDNNYLEDIEKIQQHLAKCNSCRSALDKWGKIRSILASSNISASDRLKQSLLEIPDLDKEHQSNLIPWRMILSSAAAMLVVGAGFVYYLTGIIKPEVQPPRKVITADNRAAEQKGAELNISLYQPNAKTVSLVGDFNNWNKKSLPLTRDKAGNWSLSIQPGKGYYQYQLLVDNNKWRLDPNNTLVIEDGFGGMNSGVLL